MKNKRIKKYYINFLNLLLFAENDIRRYIIISCKKFNYKVNRLI